LDPDLQLLSLCPFNHYAISPNSQYVVSGLCHPEKYLEYIRQALGILAILERILAIAAWQEI
jgi:hypothetical protein